MRARRIRHAAGLALVSAAALALSASAATKPLVLTDAKGDANAVHGQNAVAGQNGQPGPGSQNSKDILSLTLAPLPGKACTGYTAVVELAGAPSTNTVYRVLGTTGVTTSWWWLQYDNNPVGGTTSRIRYTEGTSAKFVDLSTPVKVDGSKLTWTVLAKDVKAANENLTSLKIAAPNVDIRTSTGVFTAPSWDVLVNGDKDFKVCS